MIMLGSEFSRCSDFSIIERIYIRIFGIPILGLRIRAWRMIPLIKRYLGNAGKILDMGSGRGVLTVEIAKNLPHSKIVGIDINKEKVNTANRLVKNIMLKNCSFEKIDIFDMNINNTFDSVVSIDVLEHIEDDLGILKKIYNLLNINGKLIIHVPNKYRNLFGFQRINFDIEGHIRPGYMLEEIENLLISANFKILEKGYTYSYFETMGNDLSYFITKGREKNKLLYSVAFPFLLMISFLGKGATPRNGSGIYIIGEKI